MLLCSVGAQDGNLSDQIVYYHSLKKLYRSKNHNYEEYMSTIYCPLLYFIPKYHCAGILLLFGLTSLPSKCQN